MSEPAVSIVVPAHNEEAVLAGNLRRLLALGLTGGDGQWALTGA